MIDASREKKLAMRAQEARIVEARAAHWGNRYRGLLEADELASRGNTALLGVVRTYQDELGGFEDYCKRRIDFAMLSGIRLEARHLRIDWAAQRAAADLLALHRGDRGAAPSARLEDVTRAVAAATFAAMVEEAQRGGEDDMIARQEFATAMTVIASTLAALPAPQRRLLVLLYQREQTQVEAQKALGVHYNTVGRWHDNVLAEIRKQLEKRGIMHAPGRGGAPRVALAVLRDDEADSEDEDGEDEGEDR